MKADLQQARNYMSMLPANVPVPDDADEQADEDADLQSTIKFKKEWTADRPSKGVDLKPMAGDDEFEGMDTVDSKKEIQEKAGRPPLIPMAKNRIKLQPMAINHQA